MISFGVYGQENQAVSKIAKNAFYYELGGVGFGLFSLNYDRILIQYEKFKFSVRIGYSITDFIHVGGTRKIYGHQYFIPVEAYLIIGRRKKYFEAGFGMPLAIDKYKFKFVSSIYVLRLGYRYQQHEKGLILRIGYTPPIGTMMPAMWGGISIGYAF